MFWLHLQYRDTQIMKPKIEYECHLPEDYKNDERLYMYMESEFNTKLNLFIKLNYNWLVTEFNKRKCKFVYLPKMAETISYKKYTKYLLPAFTQDIKFETSDVYKILYKDVFNAPKSPFLMRIKLYCAEYIAEGWEFDNCNYFKIKSQILEFLKYIDKEDRKQRETKQNSSVLYKKHDNDSSATLFRILDEDSDHLMFRESDTEYNTTIKPVIAEELFEFYINNAEYIEATNQIYEGIKKLHDLGLGSLIIQSIAQRDTRLSRIRIDDDYNIILPDYNNMKVEMAPITKALFLLFLRHKDGIAIKDLPDYRKELTALYWDMIKSDNEAAVTATVERVTDPFNNDVNVHFSRIKRAFTFMFNPDLAVNYYIDGKRGEPKKIALPRELVEWND